MYLEKINSPDDVKKLTVDEMTALAEEMRKAPHKMLTGRKESYLHLPQV